MVETGMNAIWFFDTGKVWADATLSIVSVLVSIVSLVKTAGWLKTRREAKKEEIASLIKDKLEAISAKEAALEGEKKTQEHITWIIDELRAKEKEIVEALPLKREDAIRINDMQQTLAIIKKGCPECFEQYVR